MSYKIFSYYNTKQSQRVYPLRKQIFTKATSYGAAAYVNNIEYDKEIVFKTHRRQFKVVFANFY